MNQRLFSLGRLAISVILLIVLTQLSLTPTPAETTTSSVSVAPQFTSKQLPPNNAKLSHAYGLWEPTKFDTCPKWLHDTYWVYGPDGKVYPTWHPPTDINPTTGQTCTYGHEHGRNPAESKLASWTVPFGYVNEQLAQTDPDHPRHEDHVGHKVEWKNDVRVDLPGGGTGPLCQILAKLHQGTHSADAFTNNMHELFYYVSCDNGVTIRWRGMHLFGPAGGFNGACGGYKNVGSFTPTTSPTLQNQSGRIIPDKECLDNLIANVRQRQDGYMGAEYYANYFEDWTSGFIHGLHQDGSQYRDNWGQAGFDLNYPKLFEISGGTYFRLKVPSRYFDPTQPNNLGRRINMCFIDGIKNLHPDCIKVNNLLKAGEQVTWDDPRSPFKGTTRTTHFDWVRVYNSTDTEKWYSNAIGTVIRPQRDPSKGIIIEQIISKTPQIMYGFGKREGDFDDQGVHAPN